MAPFLVFLLFVFNLFSPTAAAPGSPCSSGIYKPLLVLSAYAPAESYCSAHYPLSTSTVTTTVSAGSSKRSNLFKRAACNADNCLRALQNKGKTATADCKTAIRIPSYASPCSSTAKYSSACSCLTSSSPVGPTTTLGAAKEISTGDAIGSLWPNILASATSVVSTACSCTETQQTTTITVTSSSPPTPICSAPASITEGSATIPIAYNLIFFGTGFREDPNNPGNADAANGFPPIITYFPGTYTNCQAVQACADATALNPGQQYLSFDLHYLKSTAQWGMCLIFAATDLRSYFTITDSNVGADYGYSVAAAGCS